MLMTACAVPGAPPFASIYPKGNYTLGNDPGYVLKVDFERRTIHVKIQSESYDGQLREVLGYPHSLQAKLVSPNGAQMDCNLNQVLPKVWDGQCTDSQKQVYDLKIGGHWSV